MVMFARGEEVEGAQFFHVVDDFGGQPMEFLVEGWGGFFAVFGYVFEQGGLILDFAAGEGDGEVDGAQVVVGHELFAAGEDGAGEAGAVEVGVGGAAAAEEVDGDAVFGAGADGVGGDADALAGDGEGFEVEEGGLGQGLLLFGDFEAALVFADVAAEFIGDEVLDDRHIELLLGAPRPQTG